ncbi:MAG: hypothetical protein AAB336_09365 [Acidobacteriota bacterium]
MNSITTIILVFLAALIFGLTLFIVPVIAYYWGPNGKPSETKEERKQAREEELRLRAEQIERSKNNPVPTRKPSFWDNRKVYK